MKFEEKTSDNGLNITEDNWSQYLQVEGQITSLIYFCGEPLEEVQNVLRSASTRSNASSTSETPLQQNLFDKLELIVFMYMKQKHFSSFQKSLLYSKYLSFLVLSSKHVTREVWIFSSSSFAEILWTLFLLQFCRILHCSECWAEEGLELFTAARSVRVDICTL